MKKIAILGCLCLLAACQSDPWGDYDGPSGGGGGGDAGGGSSSGVMDLGMLSSFDVAVDTTALSETDTIPQTENDRWYAQYVESNFTENYTTQVQYNGTSATVTGVADGDTVEVDGAQVVIKAHGKGMLLRVTGTTSNGSLKVYSDKKFELLLSSASITSTQGAAVNVQSGKCFVVIQGSNLLSDATSATYQTSDGEDMKAVLCGEEDLRFSGSGRLTVRALNTVGKNAITSDDDIFIRPGTNILVEAGSSAGNGIKSNGKLTLRGGVVNVTTAAAGSKALKSESDIRVYGGRLTAITTGGVDTSDSSDPSGCAALKADSTVLIAGGELHLKSTGQGGKGISADQQVTLTGGTTWVITSGSQYGSSNDQGGGGGMRPGGGGGMWGGSTSSGNSVSPKGVRSDGNILIQGGELYVRTSGSNAEGIESKATLSISGGSTAISAYDDGMNASTAINISGGQTFAISTGQCDGVDSNGSLNCSGGLLIGVASTLSSEDGLDGESSMTVTGGTMVGFSNGGMSQGTRISGHYFTSTISGSAGSYLALCSGSTPLYVFSLPRTYSSGRLLFITGALGSGSYKLVTGTTPTGGTQWMNCYQGATSISGGSTTSVTLQ